MLINQQRICQISTVYYSKEVYCYVGNAQDQPKVAGVTVHWAKRLEGNGLEGILGCQFPVFGSPANGEPSATAPADILQSGSRRLQYLYMSLKSQDGGAGGNAGSTKVCAMFGLCEKNGVFLASIYRSLLADGFRLDRPTIQQHRRADRGASTLHSTWTVTWAGDFTFYAYYGRPM